MWVVTSLLSLTAESNRKQQAEMVTCPKQLVITFWLKAQKQMGELHSKLIKLLSIVLFQNNFTFINLIELKYS